jgi:hypothetical protein
MELVEDIPWNADLKQVNAAFKNLEDAIRKNPNHWTKQSQKAILREQRIDKAPSIMEGTDEMLASLRDELKILKQQADASRKATWFEQ